MKLEYVRIIYICMYGHVQRATKRSDEDYMLTNVFVKLTLSSKNVKSGPDKIWRLSMLRVMPRNNDVKLNINQRKFKHLV